MAVLIIDCYIELFETGFMQVLYLGRAPRTKETLPDFLKWRRVTRHPLVFRGLTGSQRTPGFEASHLLYPKHVIKLLGYNLGCYNVSKRIINLL